MSDQSNSEDVPEVTEAYEQYDEVAETAEGVDDEEFGALDPEGDLTRLTEIGVDAAANEEIGANFDDPERFALLDGDMDDPDGSYP